VFLQRLDQSLVGYRAVVPVLGGCETTGVTVRYDGE
jgi:hypothetical protein